MFWEVERWAVLCIYSVDEDVLALCGIHVIRNGSHETGDIARTAGTTEPGLPFVLPHAFQRIVVEEAVAAK